MPEASDIIDALILIVDPEKKTHVKLSYALTALSFGLSFIPVVGPELELSTISLAAANLALDGIKKAPDVAQSLWPSDDEGNQEQQISALRSSIPKLETSLLENLGRGLSLVQDVDQTNTSTFLTFASGGQFSKSNQPSLLLPYSETGEDVTTAITQPLLLTFNTFLVSTALAQNG